jgi:hypothetical protein
MLDNPQDFTAIRYTVTEIAKADKLEVIVELLSDGHITIEQTDYDNWNGGTYGYTVYVVINVKTFVEIKNDIFNIEALLLDIFSIATRHLSNERITKISCVPIAEAKGLPLPNPDRPFTIIETKKREELASLLNKVSEDELIEDLLLPLFRQLGFHRITSAGHKDKALEYGKDIWMKFTLPTQHVLYFGIQVKKGKLDASGMGKSGNINIAEIYNQVSMMLGHVIFDPEIGKRVLVDHAFIIAGGGITKAAKNWLGEKLDVSKRSQVMFIDREDILNLYVVTNLPLPSAAIKKAITTDDDLPF